MGIRATSKGVQAQDHIGNDLSGHEKKSNRVRGTYLLETVEGGHAKCLGVRTLEVIGASQGIIGETRT